MNFKKRSARCNLIEKSWEKSSSIPVQNHYCLSNMDYTKEDQEQKTMAGPNRMDSIFLIIEIHPVKCEAFRCETVGQNLTMHVLNGRGASSHPKQKHFFLYIFLCYFQFWDSWVLIQWPTSQFIHAVKWVCTPIIYQFKWDKGIMYYIYLRIYPVPSNLVFLKKSIGLTDIIHLSGTHLYHTHI